MCPLQEDRGHGRHLLQPQHKKPTFAQKSCMAEEVCMTEVCGSGYEHNANKFPYTAEYWKTPMEGATAFVFKVRPQIVCLAVLMCALSRSGFWVAAAVQTLTTERLLQLLCETDLCPLADLCTFNNVDPMDA